MKFSKSRARWFVSFLVVVLSACNSGSGDNAKGPVGDDPSGEAENRLSGPPKNVSLNYGSVKAFTFKWTDVEGATHYQLLENADGNSGFSPKAEAIPPGVGSFTLEVPLHARVNAEYILQACDADTCFDADTLLVSGDLAGSIGYLKASVPGASDYFGSRVAMSGDGQTLAVGAPFKDMNPGNQTDDPASEHSGAVYIFVREAGIWVQKAYLESDIAAESNNFGTAVGLNHDGRILAVGSAGKGESQIVPSVEGAGAVSVFAYESGIWSRQAYLQATNADVGDEFGTALDLSADGQTLAVGAREEASRSIGVNGDGADNSADGAGAAYVFTNEEGTWSQHSYLKANETTAFDRFGVGVALSSDGHTLAVGAAGAEAVYIFARETGAWRPYAKYLKASNDEPGDHFGEVLSLSADGKTLAVGARLEGSGAIGVNGVGLDNSAPDSGAVYVFTLTADIWSQHAYIKASNSNGGDWFGASLALSGDGETLIVGAPYEDSGALGFDGDQFNNTADKSGAVYVFTLDAGTWSQQSYLKAFNTQRLDAFGASVSLSANADTIAVGAYGEDSNSIGVNAGDAVQTNNSLINSGAVYLF